MRNLAGIRKSLDLKTAKIAAATFTAPSLDYCNALLHDLPKNQIHKIQLVQNSTANSNGSEKNFYITQAKKELHCQLIETRCKLKIITNLEGMK